MALCKLGSIISESDATDEEKAALLHALVMCKSNGDWVWSAKRLSFAINQTRFSCGATTIKDHRNKVCGCYK